MNRFRTCLPQIIASVVTIFLISDIGFSLSYPTVMTAALTGLNNKTNLDETLKMTGAQVSWMGSISYLGKMFGSFACGFASQYFGHRNALILINIPQFVAFILFYYASTVSKVFIANLLLGFGCGFMKAPSTTYLTEISETEIRGILVSMSTIAITSTPLIVFSMSLLTSWRNIALYWCVIQAIATVALFCVPESPLWYLSKQREEYALKSLKWLRGWVSEKNVQTEFDAMKRYNDSSNSCDACKKSSVKCTHQNEIQTTWQAIKELGRKRSLKPYFIILIMCTTTFFSGTHHLNVYMVQILNAYRSPIDPNLATIIVSCIGMCATFVGVIGLKIMGKRKLYLCALTGVTLSDLFLSIYGFVYLPTKTKSYEHSDEMLNESVSFTPLIAFSVLRFCTTITLLVPFSMFSELYSLKARSMGSSLSMITNNIMVSIAIKSFYNLEHWSNLPTTMGIYSLIGFVGLIMIYNILPETEGRTLEEIELHFADNSKTWFDHYIHHNDDSKAPAQQIPA